MTENRRKADRVTLGTIVNVLIGVMFIFGGGWFLYREINGPDVHTWHVAIAFISAVFGALMINPEAVTDRLKRLSSVVRSLLPGHRRDSTEISARRDDGGPSGG